MGGFGAGLRGLGGFGAAQLEKIRSAILKQFETVRKKFAVKYIILYEILKQFEIFFAISKKRGQPSRSLTVPRCSKVVES